jgi:Ca-activated chloride channel family protein
MYVGGHKEYVNVPVEIDTKTLSMIADKTDAKTYRATNTEKLFDVYEEIDQLERTKMNVRKYSKRYESYQIFALISFISLALALLLRSTVLKRIP